MEGMLTGAIVLASSAIGVYFLRFWRTTRDRFFLYFALSFWIEALNRLRVGIMNPAHEDTAGYYLIRLLAYGLILVAIWEKNRRRN